MKEYAKDTKVRILAVWIRALPEKVTDPKLGKKTPASLSLLNPRYLAPPHNVIKWQMGFNSAFKGLTIKNSRRCSLCVECFVWILEQTAAFALYVIN
jgi:hypothetical protein